MLPIKDCFYIFKRASISRGVRGRKRLNVTLSSGVYDNLCEQNCRLAIYKVKHIRAVDSPPPSFFSPSLLIGSHFQELTCNDLKKKRGEEILTSKQPKQKVTFSLHGSVCSGSDLKILILIPATLIPRF